MNNESILDIYSDPKNAVDHWMVELELSRKIPLILGKRNQRK